MAATHQVHIFNFSFFIHNKRYHYNRIHQLSSNKFLVRTQSYFSIETLDSLLRDEFHTRKIRFQLFDSTHTKRPIILGNTIFSNDSLPFQFPSEIAGKQRVVDTADYNFKTCVTNRTIYLLSSMGIWLYSSITLLLVLCVLFSLVYKAGNWHY